MLITYPAIKNGGNVICPLYGRLAPDEIRDEFVGEPRDGKPLSSKTRRSRNFLT